jgi:hypothetical protein
VLCGCSARLWHQSAGYRAPWLCPVLCMVAFHEKNGRRFVLLCAASYIVLHTPLRGNREPATSLQPHNTNSYMNNCLCMPVDDMHEVRQY